jgi:hypothetical protein
LKSVSFRLRMHLTAAASDQRRSGQLLPEERASVC